MKHLRIQHTVLVIISVAAVIVAAAAYAFMYRAVGAAESAAAGYRSKIASAQAEKLAAGDEAAVFAATSADRARLPELFVSASDAVPFIDAVDAVGAESGAVVSISSIADSSSGSAAAITAHVAVTGSWPEVMSAVGLIENLPYAVSESKLILSESGAPGPKSSHDWSAAMDISVLSSP